MHATPASPHLQTNQSKPRASDSFCLNFSVLHRPTGRPALRIFPFVCIGQDLSIMSNGIQICVSGIFLSPSGDVSIILKDRPSPSDLSLIIEQLRKWGYDNLDSTASDCTYLSSGQAYGIIDIMTSHGHLKFSDSEALANAVSQNMDNGCFYLLCADNKI